MTMVAESSPLATMPMLINLYEINFFINMLYLHFYHFSKLWDYINIGAPPRDREGPFYPTHTTSWVPIAWNARGHGVKRYHTDLFSRNIPTSAPTVYPKKYAHGFVVLCFVVVMQSFIMNSHEVFIHIHQGCFAGTGAIVRLPQCQWSRPDGYEKISQCITKTKHSKAKTVCIFLGIYCIQNGLPAMGIPLLI